MFIRHTAFFSFLGDLLLVIGRDTDDELGGESPLTL